MKRFVAATCLLAALALPAAAQTYYTPDDSEYKTSIYEDSPVEAVFLVSLSWGLSGEDKGRPLQIGVELCASLSGYQAGMGISFGGPSGLGVYIPVAYLVDVPLNNVYIPVRGIVGFGVNGDLWAGIYSGALYRELNKEMNLEVGALIGAEAHTRLSYSRGGGVFCAEIIGAGIWVPDESQWETEYVYY